MSACLEGCLRIANTWRRVAELLEFVSRVLEEGALSKPIALKLRCRLQFADGQLLGRVGRLCLKAVTNALTATQAHNYPTSAGLCSPGFRTC